MKKKILQYMFLSCSLIILFSSCRKDPYNGKETLQSGKTFVWIDGAPQNSQFFDVFNDIKQVPMFIVRRDAASNADLQKAVTVTLTALNIDTLNAHNGTNYTQMPTSVYTVDAEKGMTYTPASIKFDFAAGDFAKQVKFEIDGSKLDLSKTYAVAFAITNFGGFTKKVGLDTIIATIAVKNQYEGTYSETGSIIRNSATGPDTNLGGTLKDGITTYLATIAPNANTFSQFWKDGSGVGGIAGLYLTVDQATNKVTVAATGNALLKNTVGLPNYYDPGTKTFYLNFDWGTGANTRIAHTTLTYVGP
jgi:hypothetical protein